MEQILARPLESAKSEYCVEPAGMGLYCAFPLQPIIHQVKIPYTLCPAEHEFLRRHSSAYGALSTPSTDGSSSVVAPLNQSRCIYRCIDKSNSGFKLPQGGGSTGPPSPPLPPDIRPRSQLFHLPPLSTGPFHSTTRLCPSHIVKQANAYRHPRVRATRRHLAPHQITTYILHDMWMSTWSEHGGDA